MTGLNQTLCLAALLAGCVGPATGDTDVAWGGGSVDGGSADGGSVDGGSADGGGNGDGGADPCPVTVGFVGYAATVSDTPIGLDATAEGTEAIGSFTYDACAFDSDEDDEYGEYDHAGRGAFDLLVGGVTIGGSGSPVIEVQNLESSDTFRYVDGTEVYSETARVMTLNGAGAEDLGLWISITDDTAAAFADDGLPDTFPMADIACCAHTFKVSDSGGTLLLQLDSMEQQ